MRRVLRAVLHEIVREVVRRLALRALRWADRDTRHAITPVDEDTVYGQGFAAGLSSRCYA